MLKNMLKLMTAICHHACIITVLVKTVQDNLVSHCSLKFEAPCLRYDFISIYLDKFD